MTSLARRVLSSSGAMLIIRFTQRGLGLISTLILARLLTPEDFGLVAIVSIVIQLFDVVATTGSAQYIIQKAELDPKDLNTAWTIDILMKGGLQVLLIVSAPFVATYYQEPALREALWLASFSLPITALLNPGLILLKKELNYRLILRLSIVQKFLSFAVVMMIVFFIHPSYWALIIGNLVSALVFTLGSYVIHSYRPALSLARIKTQWSFSQWILLKSLFGYTRSQIDTILVSRLFSVGEVGKFHMIKHLTSIPATDIVSPALEPLLSAFSISKNSDPDMLPQRFRIALLVVFSIILPLCIFMWFYPGPIVDVLLGQQWSDTHNLLSALSLLLFAMALNQFLEFYCISQAMVKQVFAYDVVSTITIVVVLWSFPGNDLDTFAMHRGLLGLGVSLGYLVYVSRTLNVSMSQIVYLVAPIFAAGLAAVQVTRLAELVPVSIEFFNLVYLTCVFFLSYLVIGLLLYGFLYRSCPDVGEILAFIKPSMVKVLRKVRLSVSQRNG